MLKLDFDEIKRLEKELTFFRGWLPFRLELFIDLTTRMDWLLAEGLLEENQKIGAENKYRLMESDNDDALMDLMILKFVEENPKFKGIIKEF